MFFSRLGVLVSIVCGGTLLSCDGGSSSRSEGTGGSKGTEDAGTGGQESEPDAAIDLQTQCADVTFEVDAPAFPCDVAAIIADKCQRCHDTQEVTDVCEANDACVDTPFPLLTWEATHEPYGGKPVFVRMYDAITRGFMPFTAATLEPPVQPLSAAEESRMLEWLRECAPPSDGASCEGPG